MKVQRESVSFDEDSPALVMGVRDVLQGSWVIVTTLLLPSITPNGFVTPFSVPRAHSPVPALRFVSE